MTREDTLRNFLTARHAVPFAWGRQDCALFAADWLRELGGRDLAHGLRKHRTARQAHRVMREEGGLLAIVDARLSRTRLDELVAGDICLARSLGRDLLAVFFRGSLVAPGEFGLVILPLSSAHQAWRT